MKRFNSLLTTSFEDYQSSRWQGRPVYEYAPRIKSYIEAKLGSSYAALFSLPKLKIRLDGQKDIVWRSSDLPEDASSLLNLPVNDPARINAQQRLSLIEGFAAGLMASTLEEDRNWGELLHLSIKSLSEDRIFVNNETIVLAGWGLVPLQPKESTIFNLPATNAQLPVVGEVEEQEPVTGQDDGMADVSEPNHVVNEDESTEDTPAEDQEPDLYKVSPTSSHTPREEEQKVLDDSALNRSAEQDQLSVTEENNIFNHTQTEKTADAQTKTSRLLSLQRGWWIPLLVLLLLCLIFWRTCTPVTAPPLLLPEVPGRIVPIDSTDIVMDEDSIRAVVSDRINVALRGENKDAVAFAEAFKQAFPDPAYQIIYYDTVMHRLQLKLPSEQRTAFPDKLKKALPEFKMLIWHESIFDREAVPSDPGIADRDKAWYLDAVRVEGAWGVTFGEETVIVAIIDDGFDLRHEEFAGKVFKPWHVLNRNDQVFATSKLKHGSHVAGTAVGNRDNAAGMAGIAPDCRFMPVQLCDPSGVISMTAVVDGILYAINQGADVINLSLGLKVNPEFARFPIGVQKDIIANSFQEEELFWKEIFSIAEENGVTVVIAGGNDNVMIGIDPMQRSNQTINVSALSPALQKADFSNYGEYASVSAPGVHIYSSVPNNRYEFMDGTSMAAPIVTGAVALIKSMRPEIKPQEIKRILQQTGRFISSETGPLIQLDAALAVINDPSLLPDDPSCIDIESRIDSLLREIEHLRGLCPEIRPDTMRLPELIEDLDFSIGRWKSTTPLHNNNGEEITIYFDFLAGGTGQIMLVEPSGLECVAPLALSTSGTNLNIDQLTVALCLGKDESYNPYYFSCTADENGYAQCTAQNKHIRANNIKFRLIRVR